MQQRFTVVPLCQFPHKEQGQWHRFLPHLLSFDTQAGNIWALHRTERTNYSHTHCYNLLNIQVLKCSHQYNSNKRWGILEMIRSWGPPMSLCLSLWQSICQNQYREGRIHFRSQLEDTDHHDSNRTHSQLWWKQRKASCSHLHRVETEKGQKASPDYNSQSAHPRVPFPPTVPCLLKITQTHHRVPPCGN